MDKYGWIIAVANAEHLAGDGKSLFTVNLVRPWCDEETLSNAPRGPKKLGAAAKTGTLWSPWLWQAAPGWVVYGRFLDASGKKVWSAITGARVFAPSESATLQDADKIGAAIADEIERATLECEYPFSRALEDLQKLKFRSHVHSLAPLTHWPARLSGGVLRLTWLMEGAKNLFEKCDAVVCLPKFVMKKPGSVVTSAAQEPTNGPFADYLDAGKPGFIVDYADNNVAFVVLAENPQATAAPPSQQGLQLSQGTVSRSALLACFANRLLPLAVLLSLLSEHESSPSAPDVQAGLLRALWANLGFGSEYVLANQPRPNIVEFLIKDESIADATVLRNAIETGLGTINDAMALATFREVVKKLGEAKPSNSWTQERHSVWLDLDAALIRLCDGKAKTADAFRADWIPLATLLASDDGLREAMGLWLANVLDGLFIQPGGKSAWAPVKERLARVGEFRRDLVQRAQPFIGSTVQWDAARNVVRKPDGDPSITALEKATLDAAISALGQGAQLPAVELEAVVKKSVLAFRTELDAAGSKDRPRPRDRGLKFDFSGWDTSAAQGSDHQIRGYAVGLCSGYVESAGKDWVPDKGRARWLTDTAMLVNKVWAKNAGGNGIAWMHEAVGATSANGEKLVSVEYEGAPVATALTLGEEMTYEGSDPDGFQAVDFAWKFTDRSLPLLGYGLYYAACATPLDNVGAVIDRSLRREVGGVAYLAELKDAGEVLSVPKAPLLQYLSSETPGAPDCKPLDDTIDKALYELSDETQAHAWQLREITKTAPMDRTPALAKVALLAAKESVKVGNTDVLLFPEAKRDCSFNISAHGTHSAFIERWLATDQLLVENKLPPSDLRLGTDSKAIAEFASSFKEEPGARAVSTTPSYHPAVSAIGVELVVFGKTQDQKAIAIDRVKRDAVGKLAAAHDKVGVQVVATLSGMPKLTVTGKSVQLDLPRGSFACLRFYALVPQIYFEPGSSEQRYVQGLKNANGVTFAGYRAFSPSQLWFETIPEWPSAGLPISEVKMNLAVPRETVEGLLSPNLVIADLKFPAAAKWAQWLKGTYLQRHEWHWTGYPVDFPSMTENLERWIPSLAGVESFREIIDVQFTTAFDNTTWCIGPEATGKTVVHRWALAAGARPARYVVYCARPMLRFRRWLNDKQLADNGPLSMERDIYANGSLVPGRMREGPFERLATPALRHSIPLTATYSSSNDLTRRQNGVMLVFHDAIRRTDDIAHVGGLGDTIEIDLVDTRIEGISEIGNNPIFHAVEPQPKGGALLTDAAFGLTFDIGPNPKVAQTAMVVRPLNSGGRWVLAMARARRMILPETELGTLLQGGNSGALAVVPTRRDGKEIVPLDFVVDVDVPLQKLLQLRADGSADTLEIAVPKAPPTVDVERKYRYLISWHKARWSDGGEPEWRCQVMLQSRDKKKLAWDTLPGTVRGFQNGGSKLKPDTLVDRWLLSAEPAAVAAKVRRIRISDYTDPRWLTFIGSFGNENPGMASEYRFVVRDGKLDMLELAPSANNVALPTLRNRDASLNGPDPTFHLALLFRAVPDAVRLRTEDGTGELVACYFVDSTQKPVFLPRIIGDAPPTNFDGCYAHILTLQRISSLSEKEKDKNNKSEKDRLRANTLPDLLECAFPRQGDRVTESLLRLLPEYLGPVPIWA